MSVCLFYIYWCDWLRYDTKNNLPTTSYTKWTEENRYIIGKYASETGNTAAVRRFKKKIPRIKESTLREFKKNYEKQLQEARKKSIQPIKSILKCRSKTWWPLLMGKFDSMVQNYIQGMSNHGAVITWSIANAALFRKCIVGDIDVDSSFWAQSLFRRMGFSKDVYKGWYTMESLSNVATVRLLRRIAVGAVYRRSITATFSITLSGEFLHIQLIYAGKTTQSLPHYKFPTAFSLSANEKHFSSSNESKRCANRKLLGVSKWILL